MRLRGVAGAALAPAVAGEAFLRDVFAAVGLVAALERLAPEVAVLARVDAALRAGFARVADAFAEDVRVRAPPVFRALLERDDVVEPDPAVVDESSIIHLPVITRCAASATASAINDPSFVALAMTLFAACVAVSAASRPASRIARRALGLALIAAAAAARPAASISLLIAALANLSTVSLLEEEPEEFLRPDFAIASSPCFEKRHFRQVTVPERNDHEAIADMLKGTGTRKYRCPSTWSAARGVAVRQLLRLTNTPLRPPC